MLSLNGLIISITREDLSIKQNFQLIRMGAKIIDGKKISERILGSLRSKIKAMKQKPGLAIVLVGSNPASEIYVSSKKKMFSEVGGYAELHSLDADTNEFELMKLVTELNNNPKIHGILVQLPLPKQIDENLITNSILPHKDVDGFT